VAPWQIGATITTISSSSASSSHPHYLLILIVILIVVDHRHSHHYQRVAWLVHFAVKGSEPSMCLTKIWTKAQSQQCFVWDFFGGISLYSKTYSFWYGILNLKVLSFTDL